MVRSLKRSDVRLFLVAFFCNKHVERFLYQIPQENPLAKDQFATQCHLPQGKQLVIVNIKGMANLLSLKRTFQRLFVRWNGARCCGVLRCIWLAHLRHWWDSARVRLLRRSPSCWLTRLLDW